MKTVIYDEYMKPLTVIDLEPEYIMECVDKSFFELLVMKPTSSKRYSKEEKIELGSFEDAYVEIKCKKIFDGDRYYVCFYVSNKKNIEHLKSVLLKGQESQYIFDHRGYRSKEYRRISSSEIGEYKRFYGSIGFLSLDDLPGLIYRIESDLINRNGWR